MTSGVISSRAGDRAVAGLQEVYVKAAPGPADLWIVYVHGFNVPEDAACRQLAELRRRSTGRFVTGAGSVAWIAYLWPSELTGYPMLNKVTYPKVLPRVPAAGNLLGDYLATAGVRRIVLVGNSLGAHVVLKAASRMKQLDRPADGIALLSAAVRTSDAERSGDYGVAHTPRESVTVNPDDSILRKVFGAGERIAQPWAPTPTAVGLSGDPSARAWTRVRLHGRDHAAYEQAHVEQAVAAACAVRLAQPVERVVAGHYVESTEPADWWQG